MIGLFCKRALQKRPHSVKENYDLIDPTDRSHTILPKWSNQSVLYEPLQHSATHCNTLQRTATHCNALQHTATLFFCTTPWIIQSKRCAWISLPKSHWINKSKTRTHTHPKSWPHSGSFAKIHRTATHKSTYKWTATHECTHKCAATHKSTHKWASTRWFTKTNHTATHEFTIKRTSTSHATLASNTQRNTRQIIAYNTLQHTATHCNTLQHTDSAPQCNTLQHTATHCNTLQHTATHCKTNPQRNARQVIACNTLQHTATHCNTLQHTAQQCNTVPHSAT